MEQVTAVGRIARRLGVTRLARRLISPGYRRELRLVADLSARIEALDFERIWNKVVPGADPDGPAKYLHLRSDLEEKVRIAGRLGLLDAPPLSILDLGCGTGGFLFMLKSRGHDVLGLDIPGEPTFDEMTNLLGIPRILHVIRAFEPLPDFGRSFDLITAFSICFDGHSSDHLWGPEEWRFFLDDCRKRLRPGGRISLIFNPGTKHDFAFIPDDVAAYLRSVPDARLSLNQERLLIQTAP